MEYRKRLLPALLLCAFALALWPQDAAAQHRGRPVRPGGSAVVVVRPSYYGGYYPYGYDDPFRWGYSGWYPYAPSYAGAPYEQNIGSARTQVTPKQAEVYVDGHLTGTVDDFDGFLQRLDVPAGEHELTFYLDGYCTITETVLFRPGATLKITYAMEALPKGAPNDPRPQPGPEALPTQARPTQPAPERQSREFGTLAIRVQPRDAAVFVDGDEWTALDGPGPLLIDLGAGSHQIEVRKDGFTTYRTTVRVRPDETVPLNVSLSR